MELCHLPLTRTNKLVSLGGLSKARTVTDKRSNCHSHFSKSLLFMFFFQWLELHEVMTKTRQALCYFYLEKFVKDVLRCTFLSIGIISSGIGNDISSMIVVCSFVSVVQQMTFLTLREVFVASCFTSVYWQYIKQCIAVAILLMASIIPKRCIFWTYPNERLKWFLCISTRVVNLLVA